MRKMGTSYGFYGQEDYRKDVHLLKLDPVSVAGCLDRTTLERDVENILFAKAALGIVMRETNFVETLRPPKERPKHVRMVTTHEKWFPHFGLLLAFTLLQITTAGACLLYASYFAVPKADDTARSIFNGKQVSRAWYRTPPSVQLPDFADLLKIICRLFKDCKRLFLLSGDWRHWFHQIRLHPDVAKYFGLTIKAVDPQDNDEKPRRRFYHWTCLPMGWSWSPWIAQCIGYAIIILALLKIGWAVPESVLHAESPPPYIVLRQGATLLFVCLWYDNVLFITNDGNVKTNFFNAFESTCKAYHASIKHWSSFGGDTFLIKAIDPENPRAPHLPIYLGVQFALQLKRCRTGMGVTLHWRPDPSKTEKWNASIESGRVAVKTGACTPRAVVAIVGRILWEQHISLRPLLLISDIIDVTRRCAEEAQRGWDTATKSLVSDMTLVCDHAANMMLTFGEWRTAPCNEQCTVVVAASDASKLRGGYIIWAADRRISCCESIPWNADQRAMHIFLKELLAATLLIERLCSAHQDCILRIGIDNSAAAWCLRRLFSTTHHGQELIRRVYRVLLAANNRLDVFQLATLDNPADVPTRIGKKSTDTLDDRLARFWSVVDGMRASKAKPNNSSSAVRHEEAENDDGCDSNEEENAEDPEENFWDTLGIDDSDEIVEPSHT